MSDTAKDTESVLRTIRECIQTVYDLNIFEAKENPKIKNERYAYTRANTCFSVLGRFTDIVVRWHDLPPKRVATILLTAIASATNEYVTAKNSIPSMDDETDAALGKLLAHKSLGRAIQTSIPKVNDSQAIALQRNAVTQVIFDAVESCKSKRQDMTKQLADTINKLLSTVALSCVEVVGCEQSVAKVYENYAQKIVSSLKDI
ncbi:hypothetical protein SEUCBS139899_000695 [Sporothrix eucalyptigena]